MKHAIRVLVCVLLCGSLGLSQEAPKPEAPKPESKKVALTAEQKLVIREAQLSLERLRLQYQAEKASFEQQWQQRIATEERAVATIALEKMREAGGAPETHDIDDTLTVIERAVQAKKVAPAIPESEAPAKSDSKAAPEQKLRAAKPKPQSRPKKKS